MGTPPVCNDGHPCNGFEVCVAMVGCVPGTPVDCDDGLGCTMDLCDDGSGSCLHSRDDAFCNDLDACNGVETCDAAAGCVPGAALLCDDSSACTAESCDPVLGCAHTPINCDDGNACNGVETCNPTVGCTAGTVPNCNDSNPCTIDSCTPAVGCTHLNRPAGNLCAGATCPSATSSETYTCDGLGLCVPNPTNCGNYLCDTGNGRCRQTCVTTANCAPSAYCSGAACVPKLLNGAPCIANDTCASSFCVDNYCCNAGCGGSCQACNLPGAQGSCSAIPAGQDPEGECAPLTCDGAGGCQ
jgi:hypothetical protein